MGTAVSFYSAADAAERAAKATLGLQAVLGRDFEIAQAGDGSFYFVEAGPPADAAGHDSDLAERSQALMERLEADGEAADAALEGDSLASEIGEPAASAPQAEGAQGAASAAGDAPSAGTGTGADESLDIPGFLRRGLPEAEAVVTEPPAPLPADDAVGILPSSAVCAEINAARGDKPLPSTAALQAGLPSASEPVAESSPDWTKPESFGFTPDGMAALMAEAERIAAGNVKLRTPRTTRTTDAEKLAATGALPGRLEITSATNVSVQKRADRLLASAQGGDLAALKAETFGSNSYGRMLSRYRDALVKALEASAKVEEAA